jgi:hypothetical protein
VDKSAEDRLKELAEIAIRDDLSTHEKFRIMKDLLQPEIAVLIGDVL